MSLQAPKENIELLHDLDAGILAQKLARALADVALGCVTTNKGGRVQLTLDMKQIANGSQVNIKHKLTFSKPTGNGKASEENTTETAVFVGAGGKLTIMPESQTDMFKRKDTAAAVDSDED